MRFSVIIPKKTPSHFSITPAIQRRAIFRADATPAMSAGRGHAIVGPLLFPGQLPANRRKADPRGTQARKSSNLLFPIVSSELWRAFQKARGQRRLTEFPTEPCSPCHARLQRCRILRRRHREARNRLSQRYPRSPRAAPAATCCPSPCRRSCRSCVRGELRSA